MLPGNLLQFLSFQCGGPQLLLLLGRDVCLLGGKLLPGAQLLPGKLLQLPGLARSKEGAVEGAVEGDAKLLAACTLAEGVQTSPLPGW